MSSGEANSGVDENKNKPRKKMDKKEVTLRRKD
jgi:hypothetical protein